VCDTLYDGTLSFYSWEKLREYTSGEKQEKLKKENEIFPHDNFVLP
jgi:hypothetical protein